MGYIIRKEINRAIIEIRKDTNPKKRVNKENRLLEKAKFNWRSVEVTFPDWIWGWMGAFWRL